MNSERCVEILRATIITEVMEMKPLVQIKVSSMTQYEFAWNGIPPALTEGW